MARSLRSVCIAVLVVISQLTVAAEPKQEVSDWKIRTFNEYLELYRKQRFLRLPGFVCESPSDTSLFLEAARHLESNDKDKLTVACLLIESLDHPRRIEVIQKLLPLLKHKSVEIRRPVASALQLIPCYSSDPGLPRLYRQKVIGPVLERVRLEKDDEVLTSLVYLVSGHRWDDLDVSSALATLLQRDPPLGERAKLVLIRCMRRVPPNQKDVARAAALKLVEMLKDKRRDRREREDDPFGFPQRSETVRAWLAPTFGVQIRFEAARTLGRLGISDPFVIDALVAALKDKTIVDLSIPSSSMGIPAPQERRTIAGAAAESLGWIGPPCVNVLPALEQTLPTIEKETDASARSASVLQVPPTRTDYLRCVGAITLIDTKRTDMIPLIISHLDSKGSSQSIPEMHVRRVAVSLLGRIGKRASPALDDLRRILKSEREILKSGECLQEDQEETIRLIEKAIERISEDLRER